MKKNRHYYYQKLDDNNELVNNKKWLEEAITCILNEQRFLKVESENIQKVIENENFTVQDYLAFLSLKNEKVADILRSVRTVKEGI